MAEEVKTGVQYKLRAGAPMPTMDGDFVLHTFWAERYVIHNYLCTEDLPGSEEFRGQGGTVGGGMISAQFSRLPVQGGNVFQGKVVFSPTFVEEEDYF